MNSSFFRLFSVFKKNCFFLAIFVTSQAFGLRDYYLEDFSNLFSFRNPAHLAVDAEKHSDFFKFSFLNHSNSNSTTDQFTYLSLRSTSFGVNFLNDADKKNATFFSGFGFSIAPNVFLGTTISFKNLVYGDIDLGLEWRQFSRVRLGLLLPSLLQEKLADFQVTLLPSHGIQISLDAINFLQAFTWNNWDWAITARISPMRGLSTWLTLGKNSSLSVGASFQLEDLNLQSGYAKNTTDSRWNVGLSYQNPSREKILPIRQAYFLTIDSSLAEAKVEPSFFQKSKPGFIDILNQLRLIESQPKVKLVFIHLETFPLSVASAIELNEAITRLRTQSKEVTVYLNKPKLKEFLIAASANQIVMEETDELNWQLPKSERYFLKDTMDKIGVEAELYAAGKYKSMPEMFTAVRSSAAHRESTLNLLDKIETAIIQTLLRSKRLDLKKWNDLKSKILVSAMEAKGLGIIDSISTLDSEKEQLTKTYSLLTSPHVYAEESEIKPRIAVIVLQGDILQKEIRFLKLTGQSTITPKGVVSKLNAALLDPYTAGIVLRISSGGGEVLASHEILKALQKARQKKPIYVSMGDVAASGGYLIALGGDRIFASDTTLTGSIGVFLGKFNLKKLYEKIGLRKEIISQNDFADVYSEHRAWSPEERKVFLKRLQLYYDQFLTEVSALRGKRLKKDIAQIAEGRVWSGTEAVQWGLVDGIKGFDATVNELAKALELTNFKVWEVEDSLNWKEKIEEASSLGFDGGQIPFFKEWSIGLKPFLLFEKNPFLFLSEARDVKF